MSTMSEIEIKISLVIDGMQIDDSALEGIGTKYNEDVNWAFDYSIARKAGLVHLQDFRLPKGTIGRVNYNVCSPFLVRKEDDTLVLEKNGRFLSTIEWPKRPKFYDQLTSDGVPMRRIGNHRGDCMFAVLYSQFCVNWTTGDQCRYCNFGVAQESVKDIFLATKRPYQIGEAMVAAQKEAQEEGYAFHFVVSGGALPGGKATEMGIKILEAIREHTKIQGTLPGAFCPSAPADLSEIDELYKMGINSVMYDLEVWNPHMFKAICPGKAKLASQENWIKALEYAASVFGRGHAITAFVLGIEEKENYFEAAEYLAEKGIICVMFPWIPFKGSKLEGHRSPHPEWHLEVVEKVTDIMGKHMPEILTEEFCTLSDGRVGCYRCMTNGIFCDELRRRHNYPQAVSERNKDKKSLETICVS